MRLAATSAFGCLAMVLLLAAPKALSQSPAASWTADGLYPGPCDKLMPHVRQGVAANDGDAQLFVAMLLGNGECFKSDPARAVQFYKLAADRGNNTARRQLALAFARGWGVPQDYAMAGAILRLGPPALNATPEPRDYAEGYLHAVQHMAYPAFAQWMMSVPHGIDEATVIADLKQPIDQWRLEVPWHRALYMVSTTARSELRRALLDAYERAATTLAPPERGRLDAGPISVQFQIQQRDKRSEWEEILAGLMRPPPKAP